MSAYIGQGSVNKVPNGDTVEGRLQALSRSATEILGKSSGIADKIAGPQPVSPESNTVSAVPYSTLDHLQAVERTMSRIYDNLMRAENALG